jgi:hypothetical protein
MYDREKGVQILITSVYITTDNMGICENVLIHMTKVFIPGEKSD